MSLVKKTAFVLFGLVTTACEPTEITPIDEEDPDNVAMNACDPGYYVGLPELKPHPNVSVSGSLRDVSAFSCEGVDGGRLVGNEHSTWVEVKCSGDSAEGHWEVWLRAVFHNHIPAEVYQVGKTVRWDGEPNAQENPVLVMEASASLDCEDHYFTTADVTEAVITDAGDGNLHFEVTGTYNGGDPDTIGEVFMEFDIAPDPG